MIKRRCCARLAVAGDLSKIGIISWLAQVGREGEGEVELKDHLVREWVG